MSNNNQTISDTLYRQLFESSADAHLIIENNKFVDCNQATVDMLGYRNKKDILSTHPSQLSPATQPDGRSSAEKADEMIAIAREKGSHRFVWDHQRANGEVFPVEVLLTMLVSSESKEQIHTVWRDISDRQSREAELLASEAKFRSYVEHAPVGIFITDHQGNFLEVNPAGAYYAGLRSDQMLGQNLLTATDSMNVEVIRRHAAMVVEKRKANEDLAFVDPTGKQRMWNVRSVLLDDTRILSFVTDITERRRLVQLQHELKDLANELLSSLKPEEMAKITAAYLRTFFKSDALGIWYHDKDQALTRSLYLEDTPLGAKEPIEYPPGDFPDGADNPSEESRRGQAYLKNRTPEEMKIENAVLPAGDESRISASILFAPIMWEGEKIGVVSVHSYEQDFFKEKHLDNLQLFSTVLGSGLQRAFTFQRLQDSLAEKEVLLKELQHRTRNNMNVIISLLNMQSNEQHNKMLSAEFKIIEERIFAMSTAYSKLQQGGSLNTVDLSSYLVTLANSLYHASKLQAHQVKLTIDVDPIMIDLERAVPLGLVFNEIMSNACKHAFPDEREGTIQVHLKSNGKGELELQVRDDGIGMTATQLMKAKQSLGLRIIDMLICDQLRGQHEINISKGVAHRVTLVLADES